MPETKTNTYRFELAPLEGAQRPKGEYQGHYRTAETIQQATDKLKAPPLGKFWRLDDRFGAEWQS